MKTICVILKHSPYGRLDAAEAVRHLGGALANGLCPVGLLLDDGVYLSKAGHRATAGWVDLSAALTDLLRQTAVDPDGTMRRAVVAVHGPSLRVRGLDDTEVVPGCRVVDDAEAATLVGRADATLVF